MDETGGGDALFNDRVRRFIEFLDNTEDHADYKEEIRKMLNKGSTRLIVSLDEVRDFDRPLWRGILDTPAEYIPPINQSLKETALAIADQTVHKVDSNTLFFVGFRGTFGSHLLNPRTIDSEFLGTMVCVEGICTRASIVRPKVSRSVHYSEGAHLFFAREYRDQVTSFDPMPSSSVYPTTDDQGNPLVIEYGLSSYRDHQTLLIQEMPERAPAGQLPRGIDVIMDDDLVDRVKPGDRVQIVGVYRSVGNGVQQKSTFKNILIANNVVLLSSKGAGVVAETLVTDLDVRNINMISKKDNVVHLLAQSLAPSIYGLDQVKKAVLLMLLGGAEKNLTNGTHLRGDINILMVGDPSTAKSQMLRFVLNTAVLAVATTGRGSTGVGLTAAVTTDKETGERRLEAGAMVMADRGVVCIDEFDKMGETDRVAIHEVMEQQTVTIAKAGIHATLNARCSVIGAANPVYGQYDPHRDPHQNIALPDSLLSRFDLLFVITDDVDDARDRKLSEHVLRMHQYLPDGVHEGTPQREPMFSGLSVGSELQEDAESVPVFEKYSPTFHSGVTGSNGEAPQVLTIPFIRRYVHYAKQRVKPILTSDAAAIITSTYTKLRNDVLTDGKRLTTPITARTLETLIRLSTAHAKARLSSRVEQEDAHAAEEILRFALFREVLTSANSRQKRARTTAQTETVVDLQESSDESSAESDSEALDSEEELTGDDLTDDEADYTGRTKIDKDVPIPRTVRESSRMTARQRALREIEATGTVGTQRAEAIEDTAMQDLALQSVDELGNEAASAISASRYALFKRLAGRVLGDAGLPVEDLLVRINDTMQEEEKLSWDEFNAGLQQLIDEDKVMRSTSDGIDKVYRAQ